MTSPSRQHRRSTHALMLRPPRPRCRGRPGRTAFTTWLVGCLWIAGTLAAAWPRDARASQPEVFAGVPVAQDGQGIKVGKRSTFHPGAALSVGYDSNVFSRGQGQEAQGSAFIQPSGWLNIGNRKAINGRLDSAPRMSDRRLDYYLEGFFGWRFYLNRKETIRDAGKPAGGIGLHLLSTPGRKFSFGVDERVLVLGQPRQYESTAEYNLNRVDHRGRLRFLIRPGGGRLTLEAGLNNEILYFLDANPCPDGSDENDCQENTSDRVVIGTYAELKWRFRDRSALVARYRFANTIYFCCTDVLSGRNEDSDQHFVYAGFIGQVAKKLDLELLAGFGRGVYYNDINGVDFNRPVFEAALTYFPTLRTQVSARVFQRYQDSLVGNYISDLGGSVGLQQRFKWRMDVNLGFTAMQRKFFALPVPDVEDPVIAGYIGAPGFIRSDVLLASTVQIEQSFGKYFVLAARYDLGLNRTDFSILYKNGFVAPGAFSRHVAWLFGAVRF